MKIRKPNEYEPFNVPFNAWNMISIPEIVEVVSIDLRENEEISLHTMNMDVLFYITEGNETF